MPPRLNLVSAVRGIPYRPRLSATQWQPKNMARLTAPELSSRPFSSSKDLPISEDKKGPNTDAELSISEEAAAISKIKGGKGPDLEQGTPVQEVVKGDKAAQEKLPKIMKDEAKKAALPSNKRSFSTSATRRNKVLLELSRGMADGAIISGGTAGVEGQEMEGLKFAPVTLPLPLEHTLRRRYDPLIEQLTGLIMRDGKKSVAQKNIAILLAHLRSSPAPKLRSDRPLVPGHPPPSHLPLNPILYLTLAIDSIAPIIRLRTEKGAGGGGASVIVPMPLFVRQRRRTAMMWLIDSVSKRQRGAGVRKEFAVRLAEECIAVVEGRSALWEKRMALHKSGVMARTNVNYKRGTRRKRV